MLYTEEVWDQITNDINALNLYVKKNRDFVRYFYRGANKVVMDSADRILLAKRLLEYAEIERDVILLAYNNRIEIWSAEQYDQLLEEEPDDFSGLAEGVMELSGLSKPEPQ
jgi:MraZ protein